MDLSERSAAQMNLVGGRLCLDFVNTVGGWSHERARKRRDFIEVAVLEDKLSDYLDLLGWSGHVGLLTDAEVRTLARESRRREKETVAVLERARALREAIYRVCFSIIHAAKPRVSDIDLLNWELGIAHSRLRLSDDGKNFVWKWSGAKDALDRMLWPVADSAAEFLTTGDLARLRECPGENCGWLFEDTSKNNRRHWCDMKTCGNLAKVRRFRQRQQA